MLTYIRTLQGITLILGGKIKAISAKEPHYEEILEAVRLEKSDAEVLEILEKELRRVEAAVKALAERQITDDVTISGGQVLFRGEAIHNSLTERMLKMLDEGFNLAPMANFLANLVLNPDRRAVMDLYSFLEYGSMPITPDGHFLAYKAVRPDYKDIHSGTIDNSVGQRPKMLRFNVDPNPEQTCSSGLHVCSFDYLPHFNHADGHVMVCKVNPKDVVAIPKDYKNTKMRVSEYEVIDEYQNYYVEHPECLLSKVSVASPDKPFLVSAESDDDEPQMSYARLSDAALMAEELLDSDRTQRVEIRNTLTGEIVYEKENPNYVHPDDEDGDCDEDEQGECEFAKEDQEDEEFSHVDTVAYDVVYHATLAAAICDDWTTIQTDIADLGEAKRIAFEYFAKHSPHQVQVRDKVDHILITMATNPTT